MPDTDREEDEEQDEELIELKHTYADSYEVIPATGVSGGYQPNGDFKLDFVYDHDYRTTSERYDQQGVLVELTMNQYMEREHRFGVSMQPDDAQEAAIWILDRIYGDRVTQEELISAIEDAVSESSDPK
jgi:hypothetical protein